MSESSTGEFSMQSENARNKEKKHEYTVLSEKPKNWSKEWTLSQYIHYTDGLIGKLDGSIPLKKVDVYKATGDRLQKEICDLAPPSSVIYLDKSARPVEWLVRDLWPVLAREPKSSFAEGKIPKKPHDYFLNIDKGDWLRRMGVPQQYLEDAPEDMINIDAIDKEHLARIRALYSKSRLSEENIVDVWKYPTVLDGQHVMILDEVKSSGNTLRIAQMLLSLAIPEATFSKKHWLTPTRIALNSGAEVDGRIQFRVEWVPAWYNPELASGRGISNRDPQWPEIAEKKGYPVSELARIGRHVLSTPSHDPNTHELIVDQRSRDLRADIKLLVEDLQNNKIIYRPSTDRPFESDEDFEQIVERVKALNNMGYSEWQKKRDALAPNRR